jgi:hypothetical protein
MRTGSPRPLQGHCCRTCTCWSTTVGWVRL